VGVRSLLSIDRMTDFWTILREIDPQSVAREAHQPIRVVICGSPGVGKRTLAAALASGETGFGPSAVEVCDLPDDVSVALPTADLFLYLVAADRKPSATQREHLRQLQRQRSHVVGILNDVGGWGRAAVGRLRADVARELAFPLESVLDVNALDRADVNGRLVPEILRSAPQLALPLGTNLPVFRDAAASRIILETARVNAEFAAFSSLPSLIPIVGGLASAGADMVVLTKNQVMLLLKLALLHQRPIDNRLQVLTEILPVVGAGFVWRSLARTLITLLPGLLAVAPRVGVAFVGTYVLGEAGQYYYRWGQRPPPELIERFRREALAHVETIAPILGQIGRRLT
jgi:hypothetical protein